VATFDHYGGNMKNKQPTNTLQTKQTTQKERSDDTQLETKPKAENIERKKLAFIKHLAKNGGLVSAALEAAGLARKTAYEHYQSDASFKDKWEEALDFAREGLMVEAFRRAVKGDVRHIKVNGRRQAVYSKSDKLLQFMIERNDKRGVKKRIIDVGQLCLDTVREAGIRLGLSEEQIKGLQDELLERFKKISLN
jgi:hypothetical protein